jgi:hypothetical protein
MKLIYHLPNEDRKNRSPFDIAISSLVKDKVIKIACPYIGLNYFENVIIDGCKDWELLTDINALISSQQNGNMAEKILCFIKKFCEKIRHLDGLHAKVIISEEMALIGSANFTSNGITENNELSIIIADFDKIQQLNIWYNTWWSCATKLKSEILTNLNEKIKKIVYDKKNTYYFSSQKLIKSYYESNNIKNKTNEQRDEGYLMNFLKHWNNKSFTEYFFDLAEYIIEKYNIKENDERLCITFREDQYKIPITIGQRYILVPYWLTNSIGLIMPLKYNKENASIDGFYKEEIYKTRQKDNACWVHYRKENGIRFNATTIRDWENATENELSRSKRSSYRKYHQDILYKFIMEKNYRMKIMEEIY